MIHNALVEEGYYPALPCKLAAVVIHRMLWWEVGIPALSCKCCCCDSQNALVGRVLSPALPYCCCCDPQNALVEEGCAIPALPCKLAAVVIHNALVEEGCAIPAVMQARCCDPQNALVEEGVLSLRCHAARCCCDSQMLWCKECAIPALSCSKLLS
jgi:hypothetical protein